MRGLGERGTTLVENLALLSVVSLALAAAMTAVGTGALGLNKSTAHNRALQLATAQMESVKAQPWVASATTYPLGVTVPSSFAVATSAQPVSGADPNVQRVVVTVSKSGQPVVTLETLKVNRL